MAPASALTVASARSAANAWRPVPSRTASTCARRTRTSEVEVGAVVVATGFKLFAADLKPQYGYGTLQERHHRDADGPSARSDAALQHHPAAGRRQGARAHRVRDVHRVARRDRRQPAVFALLLHVLHQAEPADHGRPAHRRRDGPLHGHARGRQTLRRVLRAGQGHGRDYVKGRVAKITETDERRPGPALRGHRERRRAGGGRVRPGRAGRGRPAQQRRPALFPEGSLSLDDFRYVAEPTRTPTRARPTSPASTWPEPRRASRTSRTRSCTPAPRWPRRQPSWRRRARWPVR